MYIYIHVGTCIKRVHRQKTYEYTDMRGLKGTFAF